MESREIMIARNNRFFKGGEAWTGKAMVDAPVLRLIDGHLFTHSYMRNNKSSGQKNVRCFPTCSGTGHHTSQVREARKIENLTVDSACEAASY